jgi:NitT/TauT family transport system substrate-binding protein
LSSAPTTALFVAKDGPIHSAKDLEGKTVGLLSIKDFSIAALYEWLAANGADVSKVKVVEVPGSTMGAAVGRGTVAAASIPEPYISGSTSDLRMLGKQFDSIAKRFYICVWATSKSFLANNGNAVRRFTEAIYATAKWANTHHNETAAILAKYSKIDPSIIKRMTRASYGQSLNVPDLQPTLDAAYKYKVIDSPVSAITIITKL